MFFDLAKEINFKNAYFDMLKYRLAYASLELEGISDDLADIKQSIKIYNQLNAINYIFDSYNEKELSHFEFTNLLCEVVKRVTGEEISDFRKTTAYVSGSDVPRSKPQMIRNDLWYLIDDYNYRIQNYKDPEEIYEIEADFHIRFLHIHPFEDGNGRVARILLLYNLCRKSIAPCIITKDMKRKYCDLIEKADSKNLALLFKELSEKELETMVSLYKKLDEKGLIESNKMSSDEFDEYKKSIGGK